MKSKDKRSFNSTLRPLSIKRQKEVASGKHKQAVRKGFQKLTLEQIRAKGKSVVQKMLAKGQVKLAFEMESRGAPRTPHNQSFFKGNIADKTPLAALDAKLIILHGQVVRLRARDEYGMVKCFICGTRVKYEESVNMHFMPRRERGTRFSDVACQAGCTGCNNKPNGDRKNYARRLNAVYGEGTSSRMDALSKKVMHLDRHWYTHQLYVLEIEKEKLLAQ